MGRYVIPESELQFSFARSSGAGGQNVNKVNSKAVLHWHVLTSSAIPTDVKSRFVAKYQRRINNEGSIVIASDESRDQGQNISTCLEKLYEMIDAVQFAPKVRRPTKRTRGSQERRLKEKSSRSAIKAGRSNRNFD